MSSSCEDLCCRLLTEDQSALQSCVSNVAGAGDYAWSRHAFWNKLFLLCSFSGPATMRKWKAPLFLWSPNRRLLSLPPLAFRLSDLASLLHSAAFVYTISACTLSSFLWAVEGPLCSSAGCHRCNAYLLSSIPLDMLFIIIRKLSPTSTESRFQHCVQQNLFSCTLVSNFFPSIWHAL